ncbi:MAG: hypothetical protein GF320_08255, partial [Armatimonadia bacterium]|nr:hypothetical protein [Armatimonadia bacterium]
RLLDAGLGLCWVLAGALVVSGARRLSLTHPRPALPLLGWLAMATVAAVVTVDLGYTVIELTRLLAAAAAFVVPLAARSEDRPEIARRLAVAVVAGGVIAATAGLTQWLRNAIYLGAYDWRTFGTFGNPNALAGYLALTTPVAVTLALLARERALRLLGWFAVLIMACAVPLTQSRAGIASFLLGMFALVLLAMPGPAMKRLKVAGGGLLALAALLLALPPLRNRLVTTFTVNHSLMFRLYCWKAAGEAALDRPLAGWGPGTYPIAHASTAEVGPTLHAHHDLLHTAVESGLPAALLLVVGLGWALVVALRLSRDADDPVRRLLPLGIACGTLAVMAHGLLESDLTVRPTLVALLALIGGLQLLGGRGPSGGQARRWVGVAALVIGVIVTSASLATAVSAHAAREGRRAEAGGRGATAARHYDRALAWYPLDTEPLRRKLAMDPAAVPNLPAAFDPVIHRNPARAVSHEALADCLVRVGAIEQAGPHFETALTREPNRTTSILGLATVDAAKADASAARRRMEELLALERSPYGRYKAVPEMLSLEFVYPKAVLAEREGAASSAFPVGMAAVSRYLETYEKLHANFADQYEGDATLIAMSLNTRGLRPSTVSQARLMAARLLWIEAEAAADPTEKQLLRNQAIEAEPLAVRAMDAGEWRGILLETAVLRAEGGL